MKIKSIFKINVKEIFLYFFMSLYLYDILSLLIDDISTVYNFITFSLLFTYLLIFYRENLLRVLNKKNNINIFICLFLILIIGLLSGNILSVIKRVFSFCMIFSAFILYDITNSLDNKRIKKNILIIYSIILILLSIKTIFTLDQYPTLARAMANGNASSNTIMKGLRIGGGFQLAYSLLFICFNYLYILLYTKIKNKVVIILLVLLFVYVIFVSQFTIALVILILSFSILILTHFNKRSLCILILMCFLVFINFNPILNFIIESTYYNKIVQIINITDDTTSLDVDARISRMTKSINTTMKYPLIGVSYISGYDFFIETEYVGAHSDLFDTSARYGLPTMIFLFYAIYKKIREYYIRPLMMAVFIVICILNPMFYTSIFLSFFLYNNLANDLLL